MAWQTSGKTFGQKQRAGVTATISGHAIKRVIERGWKQCDCQAGFSAWIILDPFPGTTTAGLVARKLGRHFLGTELSPTYFRLANERLAQPSTGTKV